MFVWQKRASSVWLAANEKALRETAGQHLAIIQKPGQKTSVAEVGHKSRLALEQLAKRFGGRINRLPTNLFERSQRQSARTRLRIGSRLVIIGAKGPRANLDQTLLIPASAAFGTGQHVTTAMSLRLLEQISRHWRPGWSLLDYGTGSGILALAAKKFGADIVVGIDVDPTAISIARQNARLNRVRRIDLRPGDARKISAGGKFDVVTANMFAELLIQITAPVVRKLKPGRFAIFSGILRNQERGVVKALRASHLAVPVVRRRGKWIALLAQKRI